MEDKVELLLSGQYYKKFQEAVYADVMRDYTLTILDVRLLLFLDSHNTLNTARDFVRLHHYTKSNVSKSIETLIERGYLSRMSDPHDKRYIHLLIQPAARQVLEKARSCHEQMIRVVFQGISQEEIDVICRVAGRVNQNIADALQH